MGWQYLPEWGISMMYTAAYRMSCRTIFILLSPPFSRKQETRKKRLHLRLRSGAGSLHGGQLVMDYVRTFYGAQRKVRDSRIDYTVGT